uniref:Reverse transcriptase domain-containing protein n=1 Tax=Trichogramma kaykai TaxID=54128 RepID=A0ABD2X3Y8_9HYME
MTPREGCSGEDRVGVEAFNACDRRTTPRSPSHVLNNGKIAASAPLTLNEGCNDVLTKAGDNILAVPVPLTPSKGRNGTKKEEPSKVKIDDFVSAPLTPAGGRADAPKVDEMKCDKIKVPASQSRSDNSDNTHHQVKFSEDLSVSLPLTMNESSNNAPRGQFPALPLTPSEGCSNEQWKEFILASEEGIRNLMHPASEREHEKYCQEAKIEKALLGKIDKAIDTLLLEESKLDRRESPWLPFYREDMNSEADILVEYASLAIASASEQACVKALLDRVLGEHEDSEAATFECVGLSEITPQQEAAIRVVVDRLMTTEPGALGLTRLTEHHIDVQGASLIKQKMRRMSPPMLQVAHDEVKKMLAEGVIEPSASAWSSAPVIVKKADGSNRFCIDYRDLNKVTKKDAYPVQNIDAILNKLRRARYITTIDSKSAYFQIAMDLRYLELDCSSSRSSLLASPMRQ